MKKMHRPADRYGKHPLWLRIFLPALAVAIAIGAILVPILVANDSELLIADVKATYTEGTIAESDVVANETFYYMDEAATRRNRELAAASVVPRFNLSLVASEEMLEKVDLLFDDGTDGLPVELVQSIRNLSVAERDVVRSLVEELIETVISNGVFDQQELAFVAQNGHQEILVNGDTVGNVDHRNVAIGEVVHAQSIDAILNGYADTLENRYDRRLLSIVVSAVEALVVPNVWYDPVATAIAREEAVEDIQPVIERVEKGQVILKKDFVITSEDIKTLQAMRLASIQYSPSQTIGRIFFILIVTASAMYAFHLVFIHSKRELQFFMILLSGVFITEMLTYISLRIGLGKGFVSVDPLLPVFILPILLALLTNRKRAGMIAAILLGSYAVLLPTANQTTVFFVVAVSFTGIYFVRYVSRRVDMVFQWFFGIVAASFVVLFNNLFNGYGFSNLINSVATISANISVTYIIVSLCAPLIELGLNLPTPFRLRELAFSDSPALVRLSQTAVGTYNHSMMVAEMAYAAAKAIDADPLLARVAGLYHDIGKQEHPEYFIENQSGDNKHNELKASLSVAIIKSHVKIGVEKGREARLPQEVLDIIREHHGNDVIAVFLKEAQDAAKRENEQREVKREDYSYHNQIPQTPESAIIMLADSVEAASRTVQKPSAQRYEKLVNQIVMAKIERKQLIACRLSLSDLETIARVFVQILTGRFHTRIEYPEEEKDDD